MGRGSDPWCRGVWQRGDSPDQWGRRVTRAWQVRDAGMGTELPPTALSGRHPQAVHRATVSTGESSLLGDVAPVCVAIGWVLPIA
jgi:hypothetical protein